MEQLKIILSISRPRFWTYLAGTYLIGYTLGINNLSQLQNPIFLISIIYFLIPANLLLYGINDFFDQESDKFNDKKDNKKEHRLAKKEIGTLKKLLITTIIISLGLFLFLPTILEKFIFLFFLFLAIFYSTPPLRFKNIPFLDSASNFLYALPGILGFYQSSHTLPNPLILIALFCWTAAMHLFSAIPDIEADKNAHLKTTAVLLGEKHSLLLCSLLWLMFVNTIFNQDFLPIIGYFSIIYPLIPILVYYHKLNLKKAYWYFPYINSSFGFLTFLSIILKT